VGLKVAERAYERGLFDVPQPNQSGSERREVRYAGAFAARPQSNQSGIESY